MEPSTEANRLLQLLGLEGSPGSEEVAEAGAKLCSQLALPRRVPRATVGDGGGAAEDADAIDVAAWDACASFEAFESRALAPESRLVAVKAVRARALGVACEAAWEFELTDSAHQALACIAAARERGATTQDVNIATSSKGGDHLIKTLIAQSFGY